MATYDRLLRKAEPWTFPTTNVREMLNEALEITYKAVPGCLGVSKVELLVAINNLRRSADELERILLEQKYGVKR